MDAIILVHLQLPKVEAPYGPPVICYDELGLRTLLLGVRGSPDFGNWYDFPCFAHGQASEKGTKGDRKRAFLENLLGRAVYRKLGGKIIEVEATGPFVGLLDRVLSQEQESTEQEGKGSSQVL